MSPLVSFSLSISPQYSLTTTSRIDLRPTPNTSDTAANSANGTLPEPFPDDANDPAIYESPIPSPSDLQRTRRSGLEASVAALRRL